MQNSNYGGHYVISSENLEGEYFVQVQHQAISGRNDSVEYQIGYSLYNPSEGEIVPYKTYWIPDLNIKYIYK